MTDCHENAFCLVCRYENRSVSAFQLQVGPYEVDDITVQNALGVAHIHVRAMVFDVLVGMQNVRTDLISPGDITLAVFLGIQFLLLLFQLHIINSGFQHLHGLFFILMLGAFVLALNNGVGRNMGDSYGRIGSVDVLPAGSSRSVGVDAQITGIDVHFNIVINFRIYKNGGEGCVTAFVGIEG